MASSALGLLHRYSALPTRLHLHVHDVVIRRNQPIAHLDHLLERLAIAPRAEFASLSGGLKRRVLLARALDAAADAIRRPGLEVEGLLQTMDGAKPPPASDDN